MKTIKKIGALLAALAIFSSCGTTEQPTTNQEPPAKQVSVFTVGQSTAPLSFTKSGQVESSKTAFVMPEIAGKITQIKVKVGDKVGKNQTLITLGNSLSTEATNISYDTALKGLDLLDTSKLKMDYSAQKDIQSVMIGYYSAKEALETAIKTKENSEDLYDEQHDYLEDKVDDLEDALDEMEEMPDYKQSESYQTTLATYEQLDSQLEQMEIGQDIQNDQTEMGINSAKRGLEAAILAVEGIQAKYSLQFIQLDSSLLQAQSGTDLAKLQKEAQNVKSPISGYVTAIQAVEGNVTAPGQILVTVQDLSSLKITTSVNENEMPLLKVGDTTSVGTITSISPALSSFDNKIAVEIKPEKEFSALSGSVVDIVFTPNTNSIFVPLKTVTIEDTEYYVKLIGENNQITKRFVETGRILGEFIEITEGLNNGDRIATSSTTFLQEGDKVVYKVQRGK
jgi:RND family efflux transporter MFP subunit